MPLELRERLGRRSHHQPKGARSSPLGAPLLACAECGRIFKVPGPVEAGAFVCPNCRPGAV
jgi:hypothetical protein